MFDDERESPSYVLMKVIQQNEANRKVNPLRSVRAGHQASP